LFRKFLKVVNTPTNLESIRKQVQRLLKQRRKDWNINNCNYRYASEYGQNLLKINKKPDVNEPFGDQGQIVKIMVKMDQSILTFFVDDKQAHSCDIFKILIITSHMSLIFCDFNFKGIVFRAIF